MTKTDIISGFLGAGKTTFANLLLRHYLNKGLKPVYIVNEFGKTGLDGEIIKSEGFEAIEIEGGCICCTLKGDIANCIKNAIEKFNPTNIVFEPSGIFIFDNFFEIVNDICKIENVFTIVDAINFNFAKAKYGSFIYNQIKNAKTIILSKTKCQDINELICDIKNINEHAYIYSSDNIDFDKIQKSENFTPHNAHFHHSFKTFTINPKKVFSDEQLQEFIKNCTSGTFGDLYRVKGVLKTKQANILLNISLNDINIKPFKGIPVITFIGDSILKDKIYGTTS